MRSRTRTAVAVGVILLSGAVGLMLLLLPGQPSTVPATPSSPGPAATLAPVATVEPSPSPAPSPTPEPLLHIVQEGETLGAIAIAYGVSLEALVAANGIGDPNLIHAGQVLLIPELTPGPPPVEPTATLAPDHLATPAMATATPSGPGVVEIAGVLGAGSLEAEVVRVRNRGGAISLEGWSIADAAGERFVFPRLVLFPDGQVTVHSGAGLSTPTHLYWGRTEPAWRSGELITLRDQTGAVVDTYIVP